MVNNIMKDIDKIIKKNINNLLIENYIIPRNKEKLYNSIRFKKGTLHDAQYLLSSAINDLINSPIHSIKREEAETWVMPKEMIDFYQNTHDKRKRKKYENYISMKKQVERLRTELDALEDEYTSLNAKENETIKIPFTRDELDFMKSMLEGYINIVKPDDVKKYNESLEKINMYLSKN